MDEILQQYTIWEMCPWHKAMVCVYLGNHDNKKEM